MKIDAKNLLSLLKAKCKKKKIKKVNFDAKKMCKINSFPRRSNPKLRFASFLFENLANKFVVVRSSYSSYKNS